MRHLPMSLVLLLALFASVNSAGQNSPFISGGVGFVSTTSGGQTFLQPIIDPVGVLPIGNHLLFESRADLREFIQRQNGNGPYEGTFFGSLEYLQLDIIANSKLTITAGRFLTPFGIYNERLSPIWSKNLQDAPLIYPIGTRTSGSSDGMMVRGALISTPKIELNYTAYFSSMVTGEQFGSGRAAGFRTGIFVPSKRLELGMSFQRFLQDQHYNALGAHLAWKPWSVPVDVKAEFAHSPSGNGYWIETAYQRRLPRGQETWATRFQPVFRMQQFSRSSILPGDFLPGVGTQQADFGLNYHLPHELRLNASYSRQFSDQGNRNTWNLAVTYHFILPIGVEAK